MYSCFNVLFLYSPCFVTISFSMHVFLVMFLCLYFVCLYCIKAYLFSVRFRIWFVIWFFNHKVIVNLTWLDYYISSFYPNVTTFGSLLSQFRLSSVVCCLSSVCLSVVCNVGAPYSGGWSFRYYFFTAVYAGHPLTSVQNFTEIFLGKPLRRER